MAGPEIQLGGGVGGVGGGGGFIYTCVCVLQHLRGGGGGEGGNHPTLRSVPVTNKNVCVCT